MSDYGIKDMQSLSFKDGVRQRIAMYLGSADMQGVYNAIQEIISNSIDEFYMGYGDKIEIGLAPVKEGQMVTITDHGRGIPFGIKEDGSNVLVDIFSKALLETIITASLAKSLKNELLNEKLLSLGTYIKNCPSSQLTSIYAR